MQAATARRYKTWGVPGKAARRRRAALYHPIQQSQVGLLTRLTAGVWAAAMGPSYVKQVLLLAPCMIVLQSCRECGDLISADAAISAQ